MEIDYNIQNATCNMQNATCKMQHATFDKQNKINRMTNPYKQ